MAFDNRQKDPTRQYRFDRHQDDHPDHEHTLKINARGHISTSQRKAEAHFKEVCPSPFDKPKPVKSPLVRYLETISIVPAYRARFVIQYVKGKPVMNTSGEYLYFWDRKQALRIAATLNDEFEQGVEVVYGTVFSKGHTGEVIPQPSKKKI